MTSKPLAHDDRHTSHSESDILAPSPPATVRRQPPPPPPHLHSVLFDNGDELLMIARILLHGISILGRSACGRSGEDTQTSIYQAREAGEWWTKLRYATSTSQFLIVCNDVFAVVLSPALADSISQRISPICQKAIAGDQEYFRSRCWLLSQSCTRGFQFQRT